MSPLYQYRCKCGNEFDAWNKIKERQYAKCTRCGQLAEKVLSVVNHTFGWRISDKSMNDINDYSPDTVERDI
ncbi:MAG: zinc ribbon domain-containing protein [Limnochordia bacterium]|nr:zinc ribbon domain-containing protein [Limnochordia bacterium]